MWRRREIENCFCTEEVLMACARGEAPDDLFSLARRTRREQAMLSPRAPSLDPQFVGKGNDEQDAAPLEVHLFGFLTS